MTALKNEKYLEDLWTDDIPEEDGEYMVTFLARWEINGEEREFHGIDIVECSIDEDLDVTWYTQDIEKRFPYATHPIEITAWMPLPEAFE